MSIALLCSDVSKGCSDCIYWSLGGREEPCDDCTDAIWSVDNRPNWTAFPIPLEELM